MSFRKFQADQLFDGFELHPPDKVLITDTEGVVQDIVSRSEEGPDIERFEGILCPGLINCHCHLELSHMKGSIPESTGLVRFVLDVVKNRHAPEEEILAAIEKAESEMISNGIVAVGDICNNALTLMQKNKGRLYYHNFIECSGYHPSIAETRFNQSLEFFKAYAQFYSIPVESVSLTPHAPYSVSDKLWEKIIHFPGNHLFTIHNQETPDEDRWFTDKTGEFELLYREMNIDTGFFQPTGKSSLQNYLSKFLPNQQLILVHNVFTSQPDLDYVKTLDHKNLFWCLCINANHFITGNTPPVQLLMDNNCELVLGTDSLASNHQLSIAAEMKSLHQQFPRIELAKILKWATLNGARALQMEQQLGSFEKGKRPGIVLISEDFESVNRIL